MGLKNHGATCYMRKPESPVKRKGNRSFANMFLQHAWP